MAARSAVEALLRERKLDRTLTSHLPQEARAGAQDAVAPLDVAALDRALAGGLPRGQVSEVVGPVSSGRTSLVWAVLGAATRRGELAALVDTFDRFDVATGASCGIELSRLLWIRGTAISKTAAAIDPGWLPGVRAVGGPGTLVERAVDRALKALNLVVQSRVCTLVALDLIDVPAPALRRLPASTWLRVQRVIEGSDTAVVLLGASPIARSVDGRTIRMGIESRESRIGRGESGIEAPDYRPATIDPRPTTDYRPATTDVRPPSVAPNVLWRGGHDRSRRLAGVRTVARVGAARWAQVAQVAMETSTLVAG